MSKVVGANERGGALDLVLLSLITLTALLLRLPTLKMGLWLDEFISIYLATRPNLQETYEWLWRGLEFNPPLNHLLMRAYISSFGTNEIVVRLPSLFWGILLIPALYWLGVTIHSRKTGLFAALFGALAPQANYFACQTRPYSLSTLLSCLCLIYFCRLLDGKRNEKKLDLPVFIVLMTLLCYSSTFGVFSLAAFVVAYVVLCLRDRSVSGASNPTDENLSFRRFLFAFGIPSVLLLPWLPTMWHQAKIIKPVDPCKLVELPWAFGACLTTMLPVPLLLGIWLAVIGAVLAVACLLFQAFKGRLNDQFSKLRGAFFAMPSSYVVLLAMTFLPAAIMGAFAGVWLGYFRYIYPFSPAEWMLLALVVCSLTPVSPEKKFWRPLLAGFVLVSYCLVNVAYILWFDQKSQSGLKLVAQAIRDGKFDHSVLMLAPDLPGPTLYYYSSPAERTAHHVEIHGFVRWEPNTPTVGDVMAEQWSSPTVVDDYVARIEKFRGQGFEYLAFTRDSNSFGTEQIPIKLRVEQLFEKLKARYKIVKEEGNYPGVTESMQVIFFKL
ncbi:MAG: glycosyltransferase family 39 protein [Candidatus Obscuribacterales bacterium]|nr:glycosyltransferase family 39 protein [Candidatus Obscuribacterales bacterium]